MLKVWTRFLVVNHPHRQLLSVLLVVNHPHRQLLSVWLVVNHPHRQLLSVWLVVNQPHRQLLSVWLVVNQPHRQLLSVLAKTSTGGRPSTANHCGAVSQTHRHSTHELSALESERGARMEGLLMRAV